MLNENPIIPSKLKLRLSSVVRQLKSEIHVTINRTLGIAQLCQYCIVAIGIVEYLLLRIFDRTVRHVASKNQPSVEELCSRFLAQRLSKDFENISEMGSWLSI
jgi:hypothetical protein